jgi:hypothetical protein
MSKETEQQAIIAWAERIKGLTGRGGEVEVDSPYTGSGGSTGDDSSITFKPRAEWWVNGQLRGAQAFSSGKSDTLKIDAGESGQLTLFVAIHAFEDNFFDNEEFDQDISVRWDVSADKSGKLTIGRPAPTIEAQSGDAWLRLDSVNPDQDETKSFVQVSPILVGGSETGNIIVKGRESAPAKVQQTFRLEIKVIMPEVPKTPDPKGTVEIGNVVTAIGKHSYDYGPFVVGKAVPEKGKVRDWVNELLFEVIDEETQHQVRNGVLPGGEKIELWGYASNTGSKELNDKLAANRINAVMKEFEFFGVPKKVFITQIPRGERDVPEGKEKEDANWRKVVVKIHHAREHVHL